MKLALSRSLFKEVAERVRSSPQNLSLASRALEKAKSIGGTPFLVLPELSPVNLSPSLTFEEGVKVLLGDWEASLPKNGVLVSFTAFGYRGGWEIDAFAVEVFALKLIVSLLQRKGLSSALLVASPYLERDKEIRELLNSVSRKIELNGAAAYLIDGEAVRDYFAPRFTAFSGEVIGLAGFKRKKFPAEVSFEELPLVVVGSPLRNYPSDEELQVPSIQMVRVGMNQLRSNFVLEEDLLEGNEITDEEERKKVWSAILKRDSNYAPYLKKGDILLPIKREKNFNVALVCQDLPQSPLFIPKSDLVIIRSTRKELDFKAMHSLAQIFLAEFKRLSGDRFRELSGGRSFFTSDLKGVLFELFSHGDFLEVLKEAPNERVLEIGRRSFREAVKRYFEKKKRFMEV